MVDALLAETEVVGYLKDAIPEATVMANYPQTNILCKVRPDYLHQARGVSINIKTAADASEGAFIHSSKDYGYDWQSSFYCTLLSDQLGKHFDEIHIVVEKGDTAAECQVKIYMFDDDTLAFARSQIWEVLQKLPDCEKTDMWPKNPAFLQQISLPLYMSKVISP